MNYFKTDPLKMALKVELKQFPALFNKTLLCMKKSFIQKLKNL